jgi:Ca-activated chloride channel family protein
MVDQMAGASFAIVTFDHLARVLAPFTEDQQCIDDAIDVIMQPSEGYAQGSSLSAPHDRMAKMLESAAKRGDRTRVVVFLSDGEATDESERVSYADLADLVDDALVVGLGTEGGATMAYEGGWGSGNVQDPETGEDAISTLDEASLQGIADELGGTYVHAERAGDVDGFIQRLRDRAHKGTSEREELTLYDDVYWVGAFPLMALLGWELYQIVVRRRL